LRRRAEADVGKKEKPLIENDGESNIPSPPKKPRRLAKPFEKEFFI